MKRIAATLLFLCALTFASASLSSAMERRGEADPAALTSSGTGKSQVAEQAVAMLPAGESFASGRTSGPSWQPRRGGESSVSSLGARVASSCCFLSALAFERQSATDLSKTDRTYFLLALRRLRV